jgi:hypothetical protein
VADRDPRVGTDDKAAAATTWRKQEMRRPRVAVRGGEMIEQALGLALPGFNRTVSGPSRARPRPYHGPTQWANMASKYLFHSRSMPMGFETWANATPIRVFLDMGWKIIRSATWAALQQASASIDPRNWAIILDWLSFQSPFRPKIATFRFYVLECA